MKYNERSFQQYVDIYYKKFTQSSYLLLKFDGSTKVIVKTKYGLCSINKKLLLKGTKANIQNAINSTNYFVEQLKEVYENRFIYDNVNYINYKTKIKLICKLHGSFIQRSDHLLNKISCPKCGRRQRQYQLQENPLWWTYTNWEKAGNKSKNFDSFKLYIIKCWNKEENFYKVGKTYTKVKRRFQSKNELPYNWEIIKIYTGEARKISIMENKLKNFNKENKYVPKLKFNGMYECFNRIKIKNEDVFS